MLSIEHIDFLFHNWFMIRNKWILLHLGQVLNRFAKDLGQIDDYLPGTFWDFVEVRTVETLHGNGYYLWTWLYWYFQLSVRFHLAFCGDILTHFFFPPSWNGFKNIVIRHGNACASAGYTRSCKHTLILECHCYHHSPLVQTTANCCSKAVFSLNCRWGFVFTILRLIEPI